MESQKLPAVAKTFDFESMKQGFLHSSMELFNRWSIPFINNSKTFDYKEQPREEVIPNCRRIDLACFSKPQEMQPKKLSDADTTTEIVQETPKAKKHSKRKRHKRRKHGKPNHKNEDQALQNKDQSVVVVGTPAMAMDCDTVDGCYSPKQLNFRCRLPSECESEDSFIVFEDNCDSQETIYPNKFCVELESDSDDTECSYRYHSDPADGASPTKMVRFASTEHLCQVHPMIQWSYAYRNARKGPWEQHALDRMRFQNRINNTKSVLDYVLQPAHRNQIYKDRFKEPTEM